MRTRRVLAIIATLSIGVGACSSTGATASPASPSAAAAGTAVQVTLKEWAVSASVATAPAGAVTFTAKNEGPDDIHEFVVIKTDLSLIDLPTDATGAVDEEGGGMTVSGEIEDIAVGASADLTLTLEPGAYVLICNIYDDTEEEAHYQEGMRASFTVQ